MIWVKTKAGSFVRKSARVDPYSPNGVYTAYGNTGNTAHVQETKANIVFQKGLSGTLEHSSRHCHECMWQSWPVADGCVTRLDIDVP